MNLNLINFNINIKSIYRKKKVRSPFLFYFLKCDETVKRRETRLLKVRGGTDRQTLLLKRLASLSLFFQNKNTSFFIPSIFFYFAKI